MCNIPAFWTQPPKLQIIHKEILLYSELDTQILHSILSYQSFNRKITSNSSTVGIFGETQTNYMLEPWWKYPHVEIQREHVRGQVLEENDGVRRSALNLSSWSGSAQVVQHPYCLQKPENTAWPYRAT